LAPIYQALPQMQLVLCRNVFIYFKMEVQDWIVRQLSSKLSPGGFFVTGCAEFVHDPAKFALERKIPAVYQKQSSTGRSYV